MKTIIAILSLIFLHHSLPKDSVMILSQKRIKMSLTIKEAYGAPIVSELESKKLTKKYREGLYIPKNRWKVIEYENFGLDSCFYKMEGQPFSIINPFMLVAIKHSELDPKEFTSPIKNQPNVKRYRMDSGSGDALVEEEIEINTFPQNEDVVEWSMIVVKWLCNDRNRQFPVTFSCHAYFKNNVESNSALTKYRKYYLDIINSATLVE